MKLITVIFLLIVTCQSFAKNYLVSQIKFQNFKSYPEYNILTKDVTAIVLNYSKTHKNIDDNGLYELAGLLAKYYQDQGLVFHRVNVIKSNPIRIVLVPGVLVKAHVRGNKSYSNKQLQKYFNPLIGQLVDSKTMKQAVLRINKLPGMDGFSYLSVGNKPGEAQLNLKVNNESLGGFNVRLSNYGGQSTGKYRLNAQGTLNNIVKLKEQWNFDASISDQTENYSFNSRVLFHTLHDFNWWTSASYQNLVLEQGEFLTLSGNQMNASMGFNKIWLGDNNRKKTLKASAGYLIQQLDAKYENDNIQINMSGLDVEIEDVPMTISLDIEKASSKAYSNFQLSTQFGHLLNYQAPVNLDEQNWGSVNTKYSIARSIFGSSIQQGVDLNINISGQYAITDLPSHRRFGLSGPFKVASGENGLISADHALLVEAGLKYFDLNIWKIHSVFELQAQIGQGESQGVLTDSIIGLGLNADIKLGPIQTQTKYFVDENFENSKLWFELSYQLGGGK